jgi:hypothetical protein
MNAQEILVLFSAWRLDRILDAVFAKEADHADESLSLFHRAM